MHIDANQEAEICENVAIAWAQAPVSLYFAHTLSRIEGIESASSIEHFFLITDFWTNLIFFIIFNVTHLEYTVASYIKKSWQAKIFKLKKNRNLVSIYSLFNLS